MGVLQAGDDLDFLQKPRRSDRGGELWVQDLERHRTLVLEIAGEVDRGHAAAPDFDQDLVLSERRTPQRGELRLRRFRTRLEDRPGRRGKGRSRPRTVHGNAGAAARTKRRPRREARAATLTGGWGGGV